MNASTGPVRVRLGDAAEGRVVVGIVVVLVTILVLPEQVWLVALAVAMASRSRVPVARVRLSRPALGRWLAVSGIFLLTAVLTMLRKPLTGHGVQLLIWFALIPGIAGIFWIQQQRRETVAALWLGSTIGASVAGIVATVQVGLLDAPRATGVVANSITFGNLALLMGALSVLLHRLVGVPRRIAAWISVTAAGLGLLASVLSGSRGGWLVVPALIGVLLWQARAELTPRRVARLTVGLLAVLVFANVSSGGMPTSRASASVTHVSDYRSTAPMSASAGSSEGARLEAWRSAGAAFRERPVTGIGWGNLGARFDRDAELGLRNPRIATFEHAHNQVLGAAANGGMLGLAALGALFAVPSILFSRALRSSDRRRQTIGLAGVCVIGSYAVFGLTEAVLENLVPITFLAVVVGALCAELDSCGVETRTPADTRRVDAGGPRNAWRHPATPMTYQWTSSGGFHF